MILFANMDQGRHWWGKRVAERGRTRTLTVLNIHPFILFIFLVLVQCRVMRLEPFLAHRQKTPWTDGQSITHIHIYTHLQSPIHLSCMSLDCGRNPEETNIDTERRYKHNTQRCIPILHTQYFIID